LPSVAVCIPTYNQAAYLAAAVESAAVQRYSGALEIWVGDDASTDQTQSVLETLARDVKALKVLRQSENLGIARNASALMRRPQTDFIVRLDSDDVLEPDFVACLAPMMAAAPKAGYGHTAVTEIDRDGLALRIRRIARGTGLQPAEVALRASLSGYRTAANVLMFRRAALEALHYYDGRPTFVEDYDLSIRMADAGYGNVYIDEPLARYRVWEDAGGLRSRRKALQIAGYIRIFDEALKPAWLRRGWNTRQLRRRRRRLAAQHCASCFAPTYVSAEHQELVRLLRELGGGHRLELYIVLCRLGLGHRIERLARGRQRGKNFVKAAIRVVRKSHAP
jgi:glycosyltransferase involved in cell wall biosynthesis